MLRNFYWEKSQEPLLAQWLPRRWFVMSAWVGFGFFVLVLFLRLTSRPKGISLAFLLIDMYVAAPGRHSRFFLCFLLYLYFDYLVLKSENLKKFPQVRRQKL